MKNLHKGASMPVLLIILLVVSLIGLFMWYRSTSTSLPSILTMQDQSQTGTNTGSNSNSTQGSTVHTTSATPTSHGTQRYTDTKLGFSFEYPAGFTIAIEGTPVNKTGPTGVLLDVYSSAGNTKVLWGHIAANEVIAATEPGGQNVLASKVTVAGVTANQRLITDPHSGFKTIDDLLVVGANQYELQFEYSTLQAQSIANGIIKSFSAQ
jgi:hypothetical protein